MFCTTGTVYSYLYDNPHPQFLCSHKHTSGAMRMHMQLGAVYSLAIGTACHWVIFASMEAYFLMHRLNSLLTSILRVYYIFIHNKMQKQPQANKLSKT